MPKPRVVIADADINYILPLQLKFVKEFFEKIEIEVITDNNYFNHLFETPQKIDVLIVSEEMYSLELQKHSISYTFLMVEELDEGHTGDLNVKRLLKYTSVNDIFKSIVSQSAGVLSAADDEKKDTQVVVVTSGYGGAGKTSIAMGISACLTKNYKRVLYVNASKLNMFQYMLDNKAAISSQDVYAKMISPTQHIYADIKHIIRYEQFGYLPPLKGALLSLGIHESFFETFIRSAQESKDFDYIIVDMDSTIDEFTTKLIGMADKVVVVSEQSRSAVFATNVFISNINGVNSDKYIFVCNKFRKEINNAYTSPDSNRKFSINEYVEFYDSYGNVSCAELSEKTGIRKTAFLIV